MWVAPGGGNFDNPANWSAGRVPGPNDNAVINTAAAATINIQPGDVESVLSLTTAANDTLSFTGGALTVAANSIISGPLTMTGGSLTASGIGATLTANGTSTVAGASLYAASGGQLSLPGLTSSSDSNDTFSVDGTGSVLNLSALTTLTAINNEDVALSATNGGELNLSGLTSLSGDYYGSSLISITDTGESTILDGRLTSLSGVTVTLNGTDTQVGNAWTTFTAGTLTVTGGTYSWPGLSHIDDSDLYVSDGGNLNLAGVTSYSVTFDDNTSPYTLSVDGTGSVLNLSALSKLTAENWLASLSATNGGQLNLTGLSSLSGVVYGDSLISITDTGGSTILDSNLTTLNGVDVTLDGTDTQVGNAWTTYTAGILTVTGGTYSWPGLSHIYDSGLYVSNGGSLALPGWTNDSANSYYAFNVDGYGSVLNLSALTNLDEQNAVTLSATNGGYLILSEVMSLGLTQIGAESTYINASTFSEIDLSGLTTISGGTIYDTGGSTILDSSLTTLRGVDVTLDGTDPQVANAWTSLTNGSITVTGGSYSLPGLTDIDGSSLDVYSGGSLSLPGLTSYSASNDAFSVDGTGSVLNLSALTNLNEQNGTISLSATNGGELILSGLTSLSGGSITDTGGSTILDGNLTTLSGVDVTLDGTDPQVANAWTSLTNGSITIIGGSYTLPNLIDIDGSSVYLEDGGSLTLPNLNRYIDLTVANVAVQSPALPQSGKQVTVGWDDENIGDAAVNAAFSDYVLVQRVNADSTTTTIASGNVSGNSSLAGGASSPQTFSFTLPDGAAGTGTFLVTVTTDSGQTVKEYNSNGNQAYGNNTNSGRFSSTLADYADLTVANVAVQSPASPQSGNQVTVGWDDENIGNAAVNAAFTDYVLVQQVNADNSTTTIAGGYVSGDSALAAGAASQQTFSFTLQDGAAGVGNFLLTVTTDSGQTVKEYDTNGNLAYANNTGTGSFSSTLAPYADLTVANLAVQTSSPVSGGQVTVGWVDRNIGDGPVANSFNDYIEVDRVNPDNSLTYITSGNLSGNSNLAAGAVSPQTFTFTLPNGAPGTGPFQVTVTTDSGQSVKEYDANGNLAYGNNTAAVNFTAMLAVYTTTTAANAAANYAVGSQSVYLYASVTTPGDTVSAGTETFTVLSGGTVVGSPVTVNVAGGAASAQYTLPAGTPVGSYTIQAVYNGTSFFMGSSDASQSLTVQPAFTTNSAANTPAAYSAADQTVALSASVISPAGTVNEGTETFTLLSGGTVIGSPVTVGLSGGAASTNYTLPGGTPDGTYTIQAVYTDPVNFLGSSDTSHSLTVGPAATTTAAATVSTSYSASSQTVALSATVTSPAVPVNEGSVTFTVLSGSTVIGTPVTANVVNGAASATYTLPAGLADGIYTIQAAYGGTDHFASSTDSTQDLLVDTIIWVSPTSGSWDDPNNWLPHRLPRATDEVVIPETGLTITKSGGSINVLSLNSESALSFSGVSLTVTSGASQISAALTMTGRSALTEQRAGTTPTATVRTSIDGSGVTATGGGQTSPPGVTT